MCLEPVMIQVVIFRFFDSVNVNGVLTKSNVLNLHVWGFVKKRLLTKSTPTSQPKLIDFDIEVTTSHGRLTTANIIAKETGTQQQNEAGEEKKDEENEDTVTKLTNKPKKKCGELSVFIKISASFQISGRQYGNDLRI